MNPNFGSRGGGFRFGPRPGESRKTLDIPDAMPVGAVIGKGGSNTRSLKAKFNVHCQVDGDQRKIILTGQRRSVQDAENELERMFKDFSLHSKRVYEVVAQDGPSSLWHFEERAYASSDENVRDHRFQLTRVGPCEESSNLKKSWIQPFHRYNLDDLMAYVDLNDARLATKPQAEVALGHLCFSLKTVDADDVLTWEELQELEPKSAFSSRWSNVCDAISTPGVKKLVEDLENVAEENGSEWVDEMSVHVRDTSLHRTWRLKYVFADGVWKLRSYKVGKVVLGSYDILQPGKPSMRARSLARTKESEEANDDVQRYLSIRKPIDNAFWSTNVVLAANASSDLEIVRFKVQSKVRVEWQGMSCRLAFPNEERSEVRVKFKLTDEAMASLGAEENESQVIVDKVVGLFD